MRRGLDVASFHTNAFEIMIARGLFPSLPRMMKQSSMHEETKFTRSRRGPNFRTTGPAHPPSSSTACCGHHHLPSPKNAREQRGRGEDGSMEGCGWPHSPGRRVRRTFESCSSRWASCWQATGLVAARSPAASERTGPAARGIASDLCLLFQHKKA